MMLNHIEYFIERLHTLSISDLDALTHINIVPVNPIQAEPARILTEALRKLIFAELQSRT